MKKHFPAIGLLLCCIALAGCAPAVPGVSSHEELSVVPSIPASSSTSVADSSNSDLGGDMIIDRLDGSQQYIVNFNFPEGMFYQQTNVNVVSQDLIPEEIFVIGEKSSSGHAKIGGAHPFPVRMEHPDDSTLKIYYDDEIVEYSFSSDENLPSGTFYYFGDILVTNSEGSPYPHTRQLKSISFKIPISDNYHLEVWFFHNIDSVGAKTYFENLISNISIASTLNAAI